MKDDGLINRDRLRESRFLRLLVAYVGVIVVGVAIGVFAATRGVYFSLLFIGIGALCGSMLLSQNGPITINLYSLQRFLFYLTIIAGFIGAAFGKVSLGPIHLFPYRVLLPLLWMLFATDVLFNRGRVDISYIKVKPYLQFLGFWLFYAVMSLGWAVSKSEAIREIIFLFMGVSIVFFTVYYFASFKQLQRFYYLWLLILVALVPLGIWETLTGNHLPVSGLFGETRERLRFIPTTVFRNPNDFGTLLSMSIPFTISLIHYKRKVVFQLFGLGLLLFSTYLIIATRSRANYLALLLLFAFFFFVLLRFGEKMKTAFLIGLVLVFLFISFPMRVGNLVRASQQGMSSLVLQIREGAGSGGVRLNLVKNGFHFLVNSVGFGVGAGNTEFYLLHHRVYETKNITNLHNWWMEILVNYGVFVFAGYIFFFLGLLFGLYEAYKNITDLHEKMICEALLLGLSAFTIASMSSSSITAWPPQWIFFGFVLAFLNYLRFDRGLR